MKLRSCYLFILVSALAGCATKEELSSSEMRADLREASVFHVEKKIRDMIHANRDWETTQSRIYRQEDIDGDNVDDTILLTGFERGNFDRVELFVCLSSSPEKVMHIEVGRIGDRSAEQVEIRDKEIIITGKKYTNNDAMCCPSQPYQSRFVVTNGTISEVK